MTDNTNGNPQGGEPAQPQGGATGASQGEAKTMSIAEAMAKIEALEKDNYTYRKAQRENEAASKTAEEKRLAEQQEWQKLATTYKADVDKLKPVAEQYDLITEAFNQLLESDLKAIPDDVRKKLVEPARARMSPVEFAAWLRENRDFLRARNAPNLDAGAGNSGGTSRAGAATPTAEDYEQQRRYRIPTIEEYMKFKAEGRATKAISDSDVDKR